MLKGLASRYRQSAMARNAGWMFAGQGLSVITQGVYFIALARLLGVAEYGVLVGATAFTGIASQYSSLGFGMVFLRHVGARRGLFSPYWGGLLLVTSVVGALLVVAVSTAARWILPEASLALLLAITVSDCIFAQITVGCAQVFQTFERMRVTATLTLLSNALRMTAAASLLLSLRTATALQWACASLVIAMAVAILAVGMVVRNFGRPTLDPGLIRTRVGEGLIFAVSGSTTVVYNDLDKAMLGHYGMAAATGIYAMGYRVLDVAFMPIRSIHAAAFPRFFRLGHEGIGAAETFARSLLRKTTILGALAALGMFVCAPIVPHLVGRSFDETVPAIRWLCCIPLLRCFHMSAGDALAGAGLQKYRLALQACAALLNLLLNLWLIPQFTWRGAAWASVLTDGALGCGSWSVLLVLKRREALRRSAPNLALGSGLPTTPEGSVT